MNAISTLPASLPITRPRHHARYSRGMLSVFARYVQNGWRILDPLAGTGKLARLKHFGFKGTIVCNELEPDWANEWQVDEWHYGDAEHMTWAADESFDAELTSPTYGNRMADAYTDHTRRNTYRAWLGRALHPANTGGMQWGHAYREKHIAIYKECLRVLKPRGLFLLNVSDHVRDGKVIPVSAWHCETLQALGMTLTETHEIETPRLRYGKNHALRCTVEYIFVLVKA